MNELRDVQSEVPPAKFKLTRVGIINVKKPVLVERAGAITTLAASLDVFVDLPATRKGVHMSRSVEAVNEILDRALSKPVKGIELLCAGIAKQLLSKHEYANRSEVKMSAEYFLERKTPSGSKSVENYTLLAKARAKRTKKELEVKKSIGVRVTGLAACPCAIETAKELLGEKVPQIKPLADKILTPTHNQRNICTLMLEVPEKYDVEANDLIRIVESAMSTPTYEFLKRRDEAELVLKAHENPKFVEDIVRDILAKIIERYTNLPDEVLVTVRSESEESIHKHNAFAERVTTLGELRA